MGDEGVRTRETRRELLDNLDEVIEVALTKYAKARAANKDRQSWGRLVVMAADTFAKILRDSDIDDLKRRLEALEARG